jgi:hypothetical protein
MQTARFFCEAAEIRCNDALVLDLVYLSANEDGWKYRSRSCTLGEVCSALTVESNLLPFKLSIFVFDSTPPSWLVLNIRRCDDVSVGCSNALQPECGMMGSNTGSQPEQLLLSNQTRISQSSTLDFHRSHHRGELRSISGARPIKRIKGPMCCCDSFRYAQNQDEDIPTMHNLLRSLSVSLSPYNV